ncbi:SDR family NAD(P)-dependent oxidoreductase [Devosia sp. FKR38]|uniref:SDR family NAD(P)-dependent oxidoreductase n=1 Tax=Devosia sp. FKR38 TaxID=2562312 RepID=UPI001485A858|nr:SDR family NAD(P)-dependent oxidoreductase [Devosia sp. FKR38]
MIDARPIIVTGASRGVGYALVRQLLAQGTSVVGVARERPDLAEGPNFQFVSCDLSVPDDVAALVARLIPLHPSGLINNAALQTEADLTRLAPADLARLVRSEVAVDLVAPLMLAYGLFDTIARRPGGFICNINSALAFAPKLSAGAYCPAKAGLANATIALRALARRQTDCLVSQVVLPLVDTDMTVGRGSGKISAQKAASAILDGLRRRRAEIWVGQVRMLRLLQRLAPGATSRMLLGVPAQTSSV